MNEKLVIFALSLYGEKEIPGSGTNPVISKFFEAIGHQWVKDDETAWCAALVGYCLQKFGIKLPELSKRLSARSYLSIGEKVKNPMLGDLVVFWRGDKDDKVHGHVGFFIKQTESVIYVLGGNQSNSINITAYPKEKLLSYIRV